MNPAWNKRTRKSPRIRAPRKLRWQSRTRDEKKRIDMHYSLFESIEDNATLIIRAIYDTHNREIAAIHGNH